MHQLSVSPTKRHFLNHGAPFFYLADTIWSAFTNLDFDEWEAYLDLRRAQGFNALQINVLPQWDRSLPDLDIHPFLLDSEGHFRFDQINTAYFDRASRLLERAVEKGMVPVLVLLWANYVKGTFFDDLEGRCVFPLEHVEAYVTSAARAFAHFRPVYFVSGDTNFSPTAELWYSTALEALKRADPDALAGLHLCGGAVDRPDPEPVVVPPQLLESPLLDFFTFQSGHFFDYQHRARTFAQSFARRVPGRPLFNAEPCYEGWDFAGGRYGRAEVRKALWQSLLSGASAGFTYGAQGVWQCYHKGDAFPPLLDDGKRRLYRCAEPPEWAQALQGPAAWEAGLAKSLFVALKLWGIEPVALGPQESQEIVAAQTPGGKLVVYLPAGTSVQLNCSSDDFEWTLLCLETKHWGSPLLQSRVGQTTVQGSADSDALVIAAQIRV